MSTSRTNVVVIGGGLAGLASAVELRTRGLEVTVVDRNHHLGGKMNVLEEGGFTFDMGPTILTMPQVIRGIIERTGRTVSDYVDIVDLDPQWRCFYDDGTVIDLRGRVDTMASSLDRQFPGQGVGAGWRSFIDYSRRMYGLSEQVFFYKDLGGVLDMMKNTPTTDPAVLKDVLHMRMHSTVGGTIRKHVREPHVAQLCEHFLQYVGSSPFLAPAILTLIAAAQVDHGCCYAMGGTRMIARSLERILREEEAEIILGTGVKRIHRRGSRATAVELEDGRVIEADVVVSNCDVQRTYRDLVGDDDALDVQARIGKRYRPACSGVVLYLGLDRQYDHLLHHDFLFSNDPEFEFADIYDRGIPARDPSVYLCVPSRTDPNQAPEGGEAFYALIHTPYLRPGQEWHGPGGLLEQYRPIIMDKIKRHGMEDIEDHIVVERHLTPTDIDTMYNAEGGAIYGLASHGRLAGGFKPRNRSRLLQNLYLAGGSANPGPGVPMVLMSGVTAALSVAEDLGVGDPRGATVEGSAPEPALVG